MRNKALMQIHSTRFSIWKDSALPDGCNRHKGARAQGLPLRWSLPPCSDAATQLGMLGQSWWSDSKWSSACSPTKRRRPSPIELLVTWSHHWFLLGRNNLHFLCGTRSISVPISTVVNALDRMKDDGDDGNDGSPSPPSPFLCRFYVSRKPNHPPIFHRPGPA